MSALPHIPVCYINKFLVRVDDFHTRITLYDEVDGVITPQGFFVMLSSDAAALAKLLTGTQAQHLEKRGTAQ